MMSRFKGNLERRIFRIFGNFKIWLPLRFSLGWTTNEQFRFSSSAEGCSVIILFIGAQTPLLHHMCMPQSQKSLLGGWNMLQNIAKRSFVQLFSGWWCETTSSSCLLPITVRDFTYCKRFMIGGDHQHLSYVRARYQNSIRISALYHLEKSQTVVLKWERASKKWDNHVVMRASYLPHRNICIIPMILQIKFLHSELCIESYFKWLYAFVSAGLALHNYRTII